MHSSSERLDETLARADQLKALWCIDACRTAVLGGHRDVCADCGYVGPPSYNSCRNRNCPTCQALDQARWLAGRRARMLPVACFHVVFTVPSELRALVLRNRKPLCSILFAAATQTLLELGRSPHRLGARLGITAGKFLAALEPHQRCEALDLRGTVPPGQALDDVRSTLYAKPWVVYAKRPLNGRS